MSLILVAAAPLVLMIFGAGGWFTTYGIAGKVYYFEDVLKVDELHLKLAMNPQHIVRLPRGWPTISNTGSYPPESCVFSQFFNMSAFLGYFVALVYYKFVCRKGLGGKLNTANFIVSGKESSCVKLNCSFRLISRRATTFDSLKFQLCLV